MPLALTTMRGFFLNWRFGVKGIQKESRSFGVPELRPSSNCSSMLLSPGSASRDARCWPTGPSRLSKSRRNAAYAPLTGLARSLLDKDRRHRRRRQKRAAGSLPWQHRAIPRNLTFPEIDRTFLRASIGGAILPRAAAPGAVDLSREHQHDGNQASTDGSRPPGRSLGARRRGHRDARRAAGA